MIFFAVIGRVYTGPIVGIWSIGKAFLVLGSGVYALVLLWYGLQKLMKVPDEKMKDFRISVIICVTMIGIALGWVEYTFCLWLRSFSTQLLLGGGYQDIF